MSFTFRAVQASACLVAVCVLAACSRPEAPQVPVRAVKVMVVGPQAPEFSSEYAGEVRARSESRLGFRVAGKLVARPAEAGQRVAAGQVLAQLDASDYQLASQAAQAQIQAASTQRDLAAADVKRYSELRAQNFISGAELERREATLKAAQASLDQAQAQAGVQANQKAYTVLVADRAGVVVAVEAEPGQVVSAGTPVVRLAYDGPRDVVVAVPEHKAMNLRVGMPASVRLWANQASGVAVPALAAQVREVAASADPVSRTFAVKLALPASAAALPLGSTAYAQLQALPTDAAAKAGAAGLIKLPTSALWQQGQGSAVWLWDAATSTVKAQAVTVATADGNQAVIAQGLSGGEQVVVAGVHVLVDGEKVTLYQEKNTSKVPPSHVGNDVSATNSVKTSAVKGQP
ncbi:MAG: efflux RND transporter periplasmic adaptor subunit [Polaromonas sp.]|nr:efflux RND transporter periplasmic adaptor subunit [Polaromonas sp.]